MTSIFCSRSREILKALQQVDENHRHPLHDQRHPMHENCNAAYRKLNEELLKLSVKDEEPLNHDVGKG